MSHLQLGDDDQLAPLRPRSHPDTVGKEHQRKKLIHIQHGVVSQGRFKYLCMCLISLFLAKVMPSLRGSLGGGGEAENGTLTTLVRECLFPPRSYPNNSYEDIDDSVKGKHISRK